MRCLTMTATATALIISAGISFAQAAHERPEEASSAPGQGGGQHQTESFPSIQPPPPPSLDNQQQREGPGLSSNGAGGHEMRDPSDGSRVGGAAQITVDTGAAKIKVRCGAGQPSNECVDMVVELLDRVQPHSGDGDAQTFRDQDRYSHRDSRWDETGTGIATATIITETCSKR